QRGGPCGFGLAGGEVPEVDRPVGGAAGGLLAVRREADGEGLAGVPEQGGGQLPRGDVVNAGRPLLVGAGELLAVGAELDVQDAPLDQRQLVQGDLAADVPYRDGTVIGGDRQVLAVRAEGRVAQRPVLKRRQQGERLSRRRVTNLHVPVLKP